MSDKEKFQWAAVLLWIWGCGLVMACLMAWVPPTNMQEILQGSMAGSLILTGLFLMILSWRLAYLSGRKNRV